MKIPLQHKFAGARSQQASPGRHSLRAASTASLAPVASPRADYPPTKHPRATATAASLSTASRLRSTDKARRLLLLPSSWRRGPPSLEPRRTHTPLARSPDYHPTSPASPTNHHICLASPPPALHLLTRTALLRSQAGRRPGDKFLVFESSPRKIRFSRAAAPQVN